jgi:hypothetical protein
VTDRFVLVTSEEPRPVVEAALTESLPSPMPIRVRAQGESPFLRHGDAVLPLVLVKERFGEFAFRPLAGRDVEIDPGWVAAHIVTVDLPLVGTTRCHIDAVDQIAGVLAELQSRGLGHLVDPDGYAGCHAARRIGPGLALSRHSWGIAVDLNVAENPAGTFSNKDPRLVDAFVEHGFGWGGVWLVPDPMHFEIISPG